MGFLFSLIFFVFIIAIVAVLFVLGILRSIFGFRRRKDPFADGQNFNREQKEKHNPFNNSNDKKKIIDENEGEYVDYEEMK